VPSNIRLSLEETGNCAASLGEDDDAFSASEDVVCGMRNARCMTRNDDGGTAGLLSSSNITTNAPGKLAL
jgi:hypothetical protein